MTRTRAAHAIGLALALLVVACRGEAPPPPAGAPRLVLLLVVDQLGADHLVRFHDAFEGGLRRLLDEGVSFTEAHHAHAATLTGPGHATIATGCHPSRHGIVANTWIDRATGEEVYSVGDERYERAPSRLECSAVGDWLKDRYPASRVFALSVKDRSAILMGGRRADGAYWYDWDGGFSTSPYYGRTAPAWLEEVNAREFLAGKHGQVWEPLPFAATALAAMDVAGYDLGPLEEDFPHAIGGLSLAPDKFFFKDVCESPWMDEDLLEVARAVISAEDLGRDPYPDLLALGFSTSDAIGHSHGPDSREFFDILVRLDRQLASFFDWLDGAVGMDKVAIVLTSDHGSVPVPEKRIEEALPAGRVGAAEIACLQGVEAALDREFGAADWLEDGPFFAPVPAGSGVSAAALRGRVRTLVEACPSVARVWLAEDLGSEAAGDGAGAEMQRRFARSYFAGRSPDLSIEWQEYFLASATSASSHGTPHRYDTHVPLVLWRPGRAPASCATPVMTVDIAPTLAAWVGVAAPARIDGTNLADLPGACAAAAQPGDQPMAEGGEGPPASVIPPPGR